MASRRNAFIEWFLTSACLAFGAVTKRLPLPVCRWLGRGVGRLAYYIVPRVRRVPLTNLDLVFGDTLTRREKARIAKGAAENLGIVVAEFSHIPRLEGAYLAKHVSVVGLDHTDPERGVVLIGAHLGNWEWMAPVLKQLGRPIAEVVRPLADPRLYRVVDATRRSTGVGTIPKQGAGKEAVRLLREGSAVGVLIDQSPRENAVPVTFFGQPTWGTIAPALFARRADVPVHTISFTREPNGHYTYEFSKPIELARHESLREELLENSQRCQSAVEALIRQHPEQWLWLHRRWKPRPELEAEWRERVARDNQD